ncbi:uncharacterized protein F4822DRAFT_432269 [Hypoxylon trugodes]|uniref:uncharacterized protein n=1 Tax=Hypoxylon trugodes TaxID=326681 RepID=UPI0021A182E3|nr:uncharacterized protein F4822DRAFT_432269 [Hypoxylon trugodes]KAI1385418.1 hypothetical protein F4822DRAFT_432269 [Hypoxylon trugodes]
MESTIFITSCVVCALSLLSVVLRVYSRILTKAGLGWDDKLVLVAEAIGIALFGLSVYLWGPGHGRLPSKAPVSQYDTHSILSLLLFFESLYLFSMCLAKLSALCLYVRIFVQSTFRLVCKVIGIITILVYVGLLIQTFTSSQIALALWDHLDEKQLMSKRKFDIVTVALNVLGDVIIITLPVYPVWKLQTRIKTKISLTILFSLATCVAVVSCIRLGFIAYADYDTYSLFAYSSRDLYFHVLEPELAIFCLNLPALFPLWQRLHKKHSTAEGQRYENYHMNNLTPFGGKTDGERSLRWEEVIAGDSARYNVDIVARTPSSASASHLSAKPDAHAHGSKHALAGLNRRDGNPQSADIKVKKTWQVSRNT